MKCIDVNKGRVCLLLAAALAALSATNAAADEGSGITVSGNGVVEAMPDVVELSATVEGNAELAADAVEKYRGNKRRLIESLNRLNIEGVSIVGSGLTVNSGTPANPMAAFQGGQANQPVAAKIAVQERVVITLSGINKLNADDVLQTVTRILDAVKDAGATIGGGPKSMLEMQLGGSKPDSLVTFKLNNTGELRQQAYEAALEEARAKAQRLSQLAGVELGPIVSIREGVPVSKNDNDGNAMASYLAMMGAATGQKSEYTSAELQKIPVTLSLSVQFDIVGK